MPPVAVYKLRYLALDSTLALANVFGLLYAFSVYARYAHLFPSRNTDLALSSVLVLLESTLVILPVAVLIVFGLRAVWEGQLLARAASVALLPGALNIHSLVRAYDIVGTPGWSVMINAVLPSIVPIVLVLAINRPPKRPARA